MAIPLIGERPPWWKVGYRGGNPFSSLGLDWCPRCQQEVDTETHSNHFAQDGIYIYRRRCMRCGGAIKYGAYSVPLLTGGQPLPPMVFEWIAEPGQDRR